MLDAEAFNALAGPPTDADEKWPGSCTPPGTPGARSSSPPPCSPRFPGPATSRRSTPACRAGPTPHTAATPIALSPGSSAACSLRPTPAEHLADAHVVATAVEVGRSIVVTGDAGDLERLAAPYPTVTVVSLP